MPTELEELVEFIHHGNSQIRQLAVANLVPYSLSQPAIFKTHQLLPVRDLKLLVKDYEQIAKNAIDILINLSTDREVLECLATDDAFLDTILLRIANPKETTADQLCMLLANLSKWDTIQRLITQTRPLNPALPPSTTAISQLLDLFVRGADGTYNATANFDYLSYLFADLAKFAAGRTYFVTRQAYDGIIPLAKLEVFTEHKSHIRRKGVASTIKNVAFDVTSHDLFLAEDDINILPYLLLPVTGNEEYAEDEMIDLLPDLQLLPPDKARDSDPTIIQTHVETLTLLSTTREGRDRMRAIQVYAIVRETHLHIEDEGVREACERLVQVLMRGEEGEEESAEDRGMKALDRGEASAQMRKRISAAGEAPGSWARADVDGEGDDEDDEVVEV